MNQRFLAVELLKNLQPLTQLGLLKPQEAQHVASQYAKGNKHPLIHILNSGSIKEPYTSILEGIRRQYL